MRYISRLSAVEERDGSVCGFVVRNLAPEWTRAESYQEFREKLVSFAEVREGEERGRSHYRVTISFEREVETEKAKEMVGEWLSEAFPDARSVTFLHHNTKHLHAHCWIDARKIDGHKLHLSAREYSGIDAKWNRVYSRALLRDEGEHLDKKRETESYKRARARGEEWEKPRRVTERAYEPDKEPIGRADRGTSRGALPGASRDGAPQEFIRESERAVSEVNRLRSEVNRLRSELARMGERIRERELEREE